MILMFDHLPLVWRAVLFLPLVALTVASLEMTLGRMFGGGE